MSEYTEAEFEGEIVEEAPAPRVRKTPAKRAQPHKPAGVRQPRDRPKSAAQIEAESEGAGNTAQVDWEGLTFDVVADPDDWDFWTVTAPLSENNIPQALLGLLGPQQAMKLRRAKPRLTNPEARELFDEINRVLGMGDAKN
jgi:hypothetical protein